MRRRGTCIATPSWLGAHVAMQTVWKAIKQSGCKAGDFILIAGAGGGLGHLAVQYANAIGLRVVGVDTGDDKRKLATSLGCEFFVDFKESKDLVADIRKVCDGKGPHAAVIAAAGGAAYQQALDYLRNRGTLVAVGLPPDTTVSDFLRSLRRSLSPPSSATKLTSCRLDSRQRLLDRVQNAQDRRILCRQQTGCYRGS